MHMSFFVKLLLYYTDRNRNKELYSPFLLTFVYYVSEKSHFTMSALFLYLYVVFILLQKSIYPSVRPPVRPPARPPACPTRCMDTKQATHS